MLPNQPPLTLPPCAPGFDLENGKLVTDVRQADVFMRGTEIATGALTEAWLVAPGGVALLNNTMLCDVVEAPASGYTAEILIHTANDMQTFEKLPERRTAFVVMGVLRAGVKRQACCGGARVWLCAACGSGNGISP